MKIRERLSYSNVTATVALVVALGTGGAYAAGEIGSRDIDNNSLRSIDLKNRAGVKGRDVKRNALSGKEIREGSLDASDFAPLAGDQGACDPAGATFIDCAETQINLPAAGRLLVVASGNYFSEGGPASLDCRLAVDGVNESGGALVGEVATDNTGLSATDGFSRTRVTGRLSRGQHDVALRCSQPGVADGRLGLASVSVLGVGG